MHHVIGHESLGKSGEPLNIGKKNKHALFHPHHGGEVGGRGEAVYFNIFVIDDQTADLQRTGGMGLTGQANGRREAQPLGDALFFGGAGRTELKPFQD